MTQLMAFAAMAATLLAGCMLGPDYQRPTLPLPAQHRDAEPPAPGREAFSLADLQWFELFRDDSLQALVRTALQQNYDVRIAVARILEAQAQLGITRSFLFPQLDGNGAIARDRLSEERFLTPPPGQNEGNTLLLGLSLFYEIDLWGRLRRETEAARAELLSTEWAQRAVLVALVADVARAYFELREFDLDLGIAKRTFASREKSLRLTRARQEQGVATRLDIRQAEQLLYTAAARIPDLERLIAQKENEIRLLLALPPGEIRRGLPLTEQAFPPEVPAGLPAALLERRPDIRQAEEVLVAANAQIGAAKALYFPTFSLTGFLGLESDDLKDFASASARTWTIGLGLLQPIFNAGRIRSINEAAAARQLQTLAQYEQVIQTAFREVSDALVGYRKTREQRAQQELLVAALVDSAALANTRFLGGLDSYLQVLDAERQLFDAELELARVRASELLNLVQLYKALGGGWTPDQPTAAAAAETASVASTASQR
ncbi:MAG: efflux transporter outer membrane subunit [Candidatus Entotheonellia bacterium]